MKTILIHRKINWIAGIAILLMLTFDVGLAQQYSRKSRENAGQQYRQTNSRRTPRSNETNVTRRRYQPRTQQTVTSETKHKKYGYQHTSQNSHKWNKKKKWHKEPYHYSYYRIPNWTYSYHPVAFRHNHGKYYFHEGRFYHYHKHHGYILIENPYDVVFTSMPYGYNRVFIDGIVYYRYGDLYFNHTPYGYRLVPRKHWIYLSARF